MMTIEKLPLVDGIPRIPLGEWVETGFEFIQTYMSAFFFGLRDIFRGMYDAAAWLLVTPPFWVILIILVALAWFVKSRHKGWGKAWRLPLGVTIGLLLIVSMGLWEPAMVSLALVLVSAFISVIVGVPFGIWAAKNETVSKIVRPILDFLQTMPAFVYLIPAIMLFSVGVVPGLVATITFAIAPGVRFTELGIRGVDREVVEAGQAFGASPWRILRQIQLPLATPTIMAGINQVIMLSLSMVVIAGLVGAGGLGGVITDALSRVSISKGFEAGLAIVILAIILDRITANLAKELTSQHDQE